MLVNKKIESTMDIKRMNVRKVIDSFLKLGQSTKAEVSRDSGLSISTCSTIIGELLSNGDLIECGQVKTLGRPSQTYSYNANRSLALCISIVANKKINSIKYALVNLEGTIIDSSTVEKEEITLEEFYSIIDKVSESNNIDAIGIAIPGMVYKGVIDYCDVRSLEGIDLQKTLEKKYSTKVIVENEMHLKAYGYYKNHPELGNEIIAVLNLPEGHTCGASLIINGQVLEGKSNFAGPELQGKTLGVIGLGAIGVLVANAAKQLRMDVLGYDPFLSVESAWHLSRSIRHAESLKEIFSSCDYITVHVPLLDSTKNMIC